LRILFLGENWYGSCARACCSGLRRLGHDVSDIDSQTIFPQLRKRSSRALRRILDSRLTAEYNELVLDLASTFSPDILIAFKAPHLRAATLSSLRKQGIALYNYYPDTSVFAHGSLLPEALPEYDCVFFTKKFLDKDVRARIPLRQSVFLPHGYDPELHKPHELDERDREQYGHDVGFVGTYTSQKEQLLMKLVRSKPDIDLHIWGNQWAENCQAEGLKKLIKGAPLNGTSYAKALGGFRINLGIMSGLVSGASQGDETTTRTYEIPACRGFMLHERTSEVLELFKEDKEIACFNSVDELAQKIDYYLAHEEERKAIAAAGHKRCVPAYSYDNRMAELVAWHVAHSSTHDRSGARSI
jgi:glycosyltransferase involved in cell wall biosynthesis